MNVRLTGNPALATSIRDRAVNSDPVDSTVGDRFTRKAPLAGVVDGLALTVSAIIATSTPVQRRDGRGSYLEVLDPAGLQYEAKDDLPLLSDHKQSARETIGRAYGITVDGQSVRATLRLSMADDVQPIRQRIEDGTLGHVSAGYQVLA